MTGRWGFFRLLSLTHRELDRIEDEDLRWWTVMVASAGLPYWQRFLGVFLMCFLFPAIGAGLAVYASSRLGLNLKSAWLLPIFIAGGMVGYVLFGWLFAVLQRRTVRRTMRNFGHNICLDCGYDTSHADSGRCPECGWRPEK